VRWQRLFALLGLAAIAAVPEALVHHDNPTVGFQVWMVLQLLGVIVAAIGVAAAASVLGLMVLRILIKPVQDQPSTFVAWSFLRAQVIGHPVPIRIARWIREQVEAAPERERAVAGWKLLLGALVAAAATTGAVLILRQAIVVGQPIDTIGFIAIRNVGAAVGIHGFLLLSASLPWRRARLVLPIIVAILLLAAVVGASFLPVVRDYVHPPTFAIGLVCATILVTVSLTRHRHARIRLGRGLSGKLLWMLVVAAIVAAILTAGGPLAIPVYTGAFLLGATALYVLAQSQPKVTLPVFVSIVGVAAGTWALIVVLSVMGGFASDLRAKMLVANAHALVENPGRAQPLTNWRELAGGLRGVDGVVGVSPQVRGDAIVSSTFNVNNFVSLRGIDPRLRGVQRELGSTIVTGSMRLLSHPDRIGRDDWRVRRPLGLENDLPTAPTTTNHAAKSGDDPGTEDVDDNDDELDAILQLAPGPASPRPPRDPIALPSGGVPIDPLAVDADFEVPIAGSDPAKDTVDKQAEQNGKDPDAVSGEAVLEALDVPDPSSSGARLDIPWRTGGTDVMAPVAPGVLIGAELARSLQVELGDRVEIITPDADVGPTGMRPRVRTFRVAGTFETGLYDADSKVAYVTLETASAYFNLEGAANVIELRLAAPEHPDAVLAGVRAALQNTGASKDIEVLDWRALNRSLFSALAFERLVIFLVLALIILVASFAIISALTMVILQKRNGIAMLQAMGASRKEVRAAFVQMGGVIGCIGTIAGLILGLSTCGLIATLGIKLPEAYYVRTLPVSVEIAEVSAVVIASLVISLVATVFPAKSAAQLSPLEGLRYE